MDEFLSRLIVELEEARTPDLRAELTARVAGLRARISDFEGARQVIAELRKTYGDGRSGVVTVSIMLAEGLVHHFEFFRPQALDRFARAQALSIAMGYDAGIALSSAWKAAYHFEFEEYQEMQDAMRLAVRHLKAENNDAITRIGTTLSGAHMLVGNVSAARLWFAKAHEAAVRNKDRVSIGGLLFNRATFMITRVRAENCILPVEVGLLRDIRMDVASAKNFQLLSGIDVLRKHLTLWDARLAILEGNYASAEKVLREVRSEQHFSSHNFSKSLIDLEIAYCQAKSGKIMAALDTFPVPSERDFGGLDVDEQLVAAWIIQQLAEVDERFEKPVSAKARTESAVQAYVEMMSGLSDKLREFTH